MGYRSTVGIVCQKGAFDKLNSLDGACPWDKMFKKDDEILLKWEYVKWYEDYHDIKVIENALDELDDIPDPYLKGMGYSMLRLGEDYGDVEDRSNTCQLVCYMIRDIDTDGFEEVKEE